MTEAATLLSQGKDGRIELEHLLGYFVCGDGCVHRARHAGECRRLSIQSIRKRKPKPVFDPEPEPKPQPMKKTKASHVARDLTRDPIALPSTALTKPSSTQLSLPMDEAAVSLIPNIRLSSTFLDTFKQTHPNPFSPIGDVSDNSLEAKATLLRIDMKKVNGWCGIYPAPLRPAPTHYVSLHPVAPLTPSQTKRSVRRQVLCLADDGCGMTEREVADYLSIGYRKHTPSTNLTTASTPLIAHRQCGLFTTLTPASTAPVAHCF